MQGILDGRIAEREGVGLDWGRRRFKPPANNGPRAPAPAPALFSVSAILPDADILAPFIGARIAKE
jgi:hypothetical protein